LPNAEFAFLSACHTATGDILGSPNEVNHLAAGLQFSGFKSVVGTLADIDGPDVARDFYTYAPFAREYDKLQGCSSCLEDVHSGYEKEERFFCRWINFVHIGA